MNKHIYSIYGLIILCLLSSIAGFSQSKQWVLAQIHGINDGITVLEESFMIDGDISYLTPYVNQIALYESASSSFDGVIEIQSNLNSNSDLNLKLVSSDGNFYSMDIKEGELKDPGGGNNHIALNQGDRVYYSLLGSTLRFFHNDAKIHEESIGVGQSSFRLELNIKAAFDEVVRLSINPVSNLPEETSSILNTNDLVFIAFDNDIGNDWDRIAIMNLVPITPGTSFSLSNAKYCSSSNTWKPGSINGTQIASQRITYLGANPLPLGSVICLDLPSSTNNSAGEYLATNFSINGSLTNDFFIQNNGYAPNPNLNLSKANNDYSGLYLMQGEWTFLFEEAKFAGRLMSTIQLGNSSNSNLCGVASDLPEELSCAAGPVFSNSGSLFGYFDCSTLNGGIYDSPLEFISEVIKMNAPTVGNDQNNLDELPIDICNPDCIINSNKVFWLTPPEDLNIDCSISDIPTSISNWLNSNGNASAGTTCSSSSLTFLHNYEENNFAVCSGQQTEVIFTVIDQCNNRNSLSAFINFTNIGTPSFTQEPSDQSFLCSGDLEAMQTALDNWLENYGGAQASGGCSPLKWGVEIEEIGEGCTQFNSIKAVFYFRDGCGTRYDAPPKNFTFTDNQAPVIAIEDGAEDLFLDCGDPQFQIKLNNWYTSHGNAIATDNCSRILDWSYQISTRGGCSDINVQFTVDDGCGNITTTNAIVYINDTIPPSITKPLQDLYLPIAKTTDEIDSNDVKIQDWLSLNAFGKAYDSCESNLVWDHNFPFSYGTQFLLECGSREVIFEIKDDCNNVTTQIATIWIIDPEPPVFSLSPKNFIGGCGFSTSDPEFVYWLDVHGGADASDDHSDQQDLVWSYNIIEPITGECDIYTVEFSVQDECGNISSELAHVEIIDNKSPTFSSNAPILSLLDGDPQNNIIIQNWLDDLGGMTVSDDCTPIPIITTAFLEEVGEPGCSQSFYEFKAEDDCGNITRVVGTIEVTNTNVTLIGGEDLSISCGCGDLPTEIIDDWLNNNAYIEVNHCQFTDYTVSNSGYDPSVLNNCNAQAVTFTFIFDNGHIVSTTQSINPSLVICNPIISNPGQSLTLTCGAINYTELDNWIENHGSIEISNACGAVIWDPVNIDYIALQNCQDQTVNFRSEDGCGNVSQQTLNITMDCNVSVEIQEENGQLVAYASGCPVDISYNWNPIPHIQEQYQQAITPHSNWNDYTVTVTCQLANGTICTNNTSFHWTPECTSPTIELICSGDGTYSARTSACLNPTYEWYSGNTLLFTETPPYNFWYSNFVPPSSGTYRVEVNNCEGCPPIIETFTWEGNFINNIDIQSFGQGLDVAIDGYCPNPIITWTYNGVEISVQSGPKRDLIPIQGNGTYEVTVNCGNCTTVSTSEEFGCEIGFLEGYNWEPSPTDPNKYLLSFYSVNGAFSCDDFHTSAIWSTSIPNMGPFDAQHCTSATGLVSHEVKSYFSPPSASNPTVTYSLEVTNLASDNVYCKDLTLTYNSMQTLQSSSSQMQILDEKKLTRGSEDISIKVYPNPTRDEFFIEFNAQQPKEVQVEYLNASGQIIGTTSYELEFGKNQFRTNTQLWPSGVYIIRMGDETFLEYQKVMIIKK